MMLRKIVAVVLFVVFSALIGPWFTALVAAFTGSAVLSVSFAVIGFVILPWIAVSKLYEAFLWPNEAHKAKVEWKTGQKWNA